MRGRRRRKEEKKEEIGRIIMKVSEKKLRKETEEMGFLLRVGAWRGLWENKRMHLLVYIYTVRDI